MKTHLPGCPAADLSAIGQPCECPEDPTPFEEVHPVGERIVKPGMTDLEFHLHQTRNRRTTHDYGGRTLAALITILAAIAVGVVAYLFIWQNAAPVSGAGNMMSAGTTAIMRADATTMFTAEEGANAPVAVTATKSRPAMVDGTSVPAVGADTVSVTVTGEMFCVKVTNPGASKPVFWDSGTSSFDPTAPVACAGIR